MKKVNVRDIAEETWVSPGGKYGGASQELSVALGRDPGSTDLSTRHPFDVEICRIPPGKRHCPYHSHSELVCTYEVRDGKIVDAWFLAGPKQLYR